MTQKPYYCFCLRCELVIKIISVICTIDLIYGFVPKFFTWISTRYYSTELYRFRSPGEKINIGSIIKIIFSKFIFVVILILAGTVFFITIKVLFSALLLVITTIIKKNIIPKETDLCWKKLWHIDTLQPKILSYSFMTDYASNPRLNIRGFCRSVQQLLRLLQLPTSFLKSIIYLSYTSFRSEES